MSINLETSNRQQMLALYVSSRALSSLCLGHINAGETPAVLQHHGDVGVLAGSVAILAYCAEHRPYLLNGWVKTQMQNVLAL